MFYAIKLDDLYCISKLIFVKSTNMIFLQKNYPISNLMFDRSKSAFIAKREEADMKGDFLGVAESGGLITR